MSTLEKISAGDLKLAESKKQNLSKAFQDLHSHFSSIASLTLQWQDLKHHFNTIQTILQHCFEELESKEQHFNSIQTSIEQRLKDLDCKEADFAGRLRKLELNEKRLGNCFEELESKEQHFNSIQTSIEQRLKDLDCKEADFAGRLRKLELNEKRLGNCFEELESKEQHFNSIQTSIEQRLKDLDCKESDFAGRLRKLELNEKRLGNALQSQVKVEPQEDFDYSPVDNANLRFYVSMDGKGLQLFLNETSGHEKIGDEVYDAIRMSSDPAKLVLDAMEGFYAPHLKKGDKEFEAGVVRRSCVLLLEQLLRVSPRIRPGVREAAAKVAGEWMGKMRVESGDCLEVLGFLLLVGSYGLVSDFDGNKISKLFGIFAKHRHAPELRRALVIAEKDTVIITTPTQVEIEQLTSENLQLNNTVVSTSVSPQPEPKSLKSCIQLPNKCVKEHDPMHCEVSDVIQDPAKLVLDEMKQFYPLNSEGDKGFKLSAIRRCIFLLEQLMRVSPQIKPCVKEEAMKFAVDWKVKLVEKIEDAWDVVCFLLLLATYGLASHFDANELLGLLDIIHRRKQAPALFRVLGLTDKIPNFIENLIEKQRWDEAIRYIYAFELVDKFPPVSLLKDYLSHSKKIAEKLCEKGNNSLKAQIGAIDTERIALRDVIRCIADHNLEPEYSPEILEEHSARLEKQKAYRLKVLNSRGRGGPHSRYKSRLIQQQSEKKRIATTAAAAPSATPAPSPKAQPQQQRGNKRPRGAPHLSTPATQYANRLTSSYPKRPISYNPRDTIRKPDCYDRPVPSNGARNVLREPDYCDRPVSFADHRDALREPGSHDGQAQKLVRMG